jgi:protein-S-isoprenylcysteine O-methyltransferase Ste14
MGELEAEVANPGLIRPPLIYLLAMLVGLGIERFWALPLPLSTLGKPSGALVAATGLVIFVLTLRAFRSAHTPAPGHQPATAVVRTGPMRFSRNPIYLAFSLMQLGLALWTHSAWVLVMLIPPVALMQFVVISREERYMEAKFGTEYLAYKSTVRRWI